MIPLPTADQLDPFHFAMLSAATPPAVAKVPPAYSAGPLPSSNTVKAETALFPMLLSIPSPSADQVDPFHFAMWFATTTPSAVFVNEPPAYNAGPLPSSNTVRA